MKKQVDPLLDEATLKAAICAWLLDQPQEDREALAQALVRRFERA